MGFVVYSCLYFEGNISDRKNEGLIDYVFLALPLGSCPAKFLATVFKNYFFFFYTEMDITIYARFCGVNGERGNFDSALVIACSG